MSPEFCNFEAQGEGEMIRLNGYYLYEVGSQIHPLSEIKAGDGYDSAYIALLIAEGALAPFLQSIYRPKTSFGSGNELLEAIRSVKSKFEEDATRILEQFDAYILRSALTKFEAVVAAELGINPLYLVDQKG